MADKYDSLREGYIAEYQKYKPDASLQDAVDYAEKRIEKLKAKEAKKTKGTKPMQKSMGGTIKKPAMSYGGTANMKRHMYSGGGQVTDNMKGLKKLAKVRPDVVRKMGYNV